MITRFMRNQVIDWTRNVSCVPKFYVLPTKLLENIRSRTFFLFFSSNQYYLLHLYSPVFQVRSTFYVNQVILSLLSSRKSWEYGERWTTFLGCAHLFSRGDNAIEALLFSRSCHRLDLRKHVHAVRHHSLSFFRVRFHDSPSPARNTVVLLLVVCVYIRGRIHFHRNFIFVLYSFQLGVAFVYPKREAIPLSWKRLDRRRYVFNGRVLYVLCSRAREFNEYTRRTSVLV